MSAADARACQMCGATMRAADARCPRCGEILASTAVVDTTVEFGGSRYEPRGPFFLSAVVFPPMAAFWGIFWSFGFAAMQRQPVMRVLPFGLAGGVVFGLFMGILLGFVMRRSSRVVKFADRNAFILQINAGMEKIRYKLLARSGDIMRFRPRIGLGLAGGILVRVETDQAVVVGPKLVLSKLLKQLEPV